MNNTTSYNTAIGHLATRANTTAISNTAVGRNIVNSDSTGSTNVAIKYAAAEKNKI